MREITLIGAFGLSGAQIDIIKENIPKKKCEVMNTDCFSANSIMILNLIRKRCRKLFVHPIR